MGEKMGDVRVAIVGLGYVGLPLAVEFSHHYPVVGFDLRDDRVQELSEARDSTLEVTSEQLREAGDLVFSSDAQKMAQCNVFIVTVPTPVDTYNRPDFVFVRGATETVATLLKKGDTVIYESTVYPGATEEICAPILEQGSGLVLNHDFYLGYSPERINPSDEKHILTNIVKVTSGSTPQAADFVDALYRTIVEAGTHKASSIKVAEAAKVIENTQRDLNIALVNELSIIFSKIGIDTEEVLQAAGTKWNFLGFRPGLVGGHCIGVDPYYLTHKAQDLGYEPEVILAGRRINDAMGGYVAEQFVKQLLQRGMNPVVSRVLILGLTFKENCPDVRNTHVLDVIDGLNDYSVEVDVYDPWVNPRDVERMPQVNLIPEIQRKNYEGIIVAVRHRQFVEMDIQTLRSYCLDEAPIYDLKFAFRKEQTDLRL